MKSTISLSATRCSIFFVMMALFIMVVDGSSLVVSSSNKDQATTTVHDKFSVNNMISQWSEEYHELFGRLVEQSREKYSQEMRDDFITQITREAIKRKTMADAWVSGSWYLGDMTVYTTKNGGGCDKKTYPFIQMTSTASTVDISAIGVNILKIDTIVSRPFSTLYNGVLTYQRDSVPICFDLKDGSLSLSSDFLLCNSVNQPNPTCSSVLDAVSVVYKSPGTIATGTIAGVAILIVLVIVCCIACCVCCCVCLARRRRNNGMASMNETLLVSHNGLVPNSNTTTTVRY